MATRYMERFFDPQSIAVIGASERTDSLGGTVLNNLLQAGFEGSLVAVNPKGASHIYGVPRCEEVSALDPAPDLAIVCTSPVRIPSIIKELGERGVRAVMIVMGGLSAPAAGANSALGHSVQWAQSLLGLRLDSGETLKEAAWDVARSYDMRIMGPNCIGTVVPHRRLNASYAHCMVLPGNVAYVGQSGVLALAVMDWAKGRGKGFSCVTSLGDSLDIDIADVLDYLADDPHTQAIVLQLEALRSGGHFVSALRAAARSKLVIMMKTRSVPAALQASGRLPRNPADLDGVYDAVCRRAGVLRVERTDQVFGALETLTRMRRLHGERLAVLCNGIGLALLASDQLTLGGGRLATLHDDSLAALRGVMMLTAVPSNPLDLGAAATPAHFGKAFEILLADSGVDAVLILHVPTLVAPSLATARLLIPAVLEADKPVLTSWMGYDSAMPAREAFDQAGVSTFDTPEQAVDAFLHMVQYRHNQQQLEQIPQRLTTADDVLVDSRQAWALVGQARDGKHLADKQAVALLAATGIAVLPQSQLRVEELVQGLQVRMGITRDPVFGPLVFVGGAGHHSARIERQVGLPPLDLHLAQLLLASAGLDDALKKFSADVAPDRQTLAMMLVRLCALVLEVPSVAELELDPLVVNEAGVRAYGVRVETGERCEPVIRPYPEELEETIVLPKSGRTVTLRPIRGTDAPAHAAFASRLSPEAIRYRFFGPRSQFTRRQLAQFTQIDYAREMAFIASGVAADGAAETLGVVRAWTDSDNVSAEFAVIVDDALRGEGLGQKLVEKLINYSRQRGTLELRGSVLPDNKPMRRLAEKLGFSSRLDPAEKAIVVSLLLNEPQHDWQRKRLARQDDDASA